MPYAPEDMNLWTDEHYVLYTYVELAVGNRKELTALEQAELEKSQEIEEIMNSDDPDWLQKAMEAMGDEMTSPLESLFEMGFSPDQIGEELDREVAKLYGEI